MTRLVVLAAAAMVVASISSGCGQQAEAKPVALAVAGPDVQRGDWFKQTGCIDCHSMSVYRIHNLTAVAPDLSIAVEDVPRRFGVPLEEFLHAPTGTMSMVLSSRIPMTREQRQLAIDRLKEAYREHQEARGVVLPVASH